jgi:hypothetical protein
MTTCVEWQEIRFKMDKFSPATNRDVGCSPMLEGGSRVKKFGNPWSKQSSRLAYKCGIQIGKWRVSWDLWLWLKKWIPWNTAFSHSWTYSQRAAISKLQEVPEGTVSTKWEDTLCASYSGELSVNTKHDTSLGLWVFVCYRRVCVFARACVGFSPDTLFWLQGFPLSFRPNTMK